MIEQFDLTEYQPSPLPITDADARWLMGIESRRFEVTPIIGSDFWNVLPGSTVGVIELPSGIRLRCQPKAPVRNVFFMLATAYGFRDPFLDQPIAFERIEELFDFLVEHLANLIDARLEQGLYRAYIEREDNLSAVRGRILIAEDLRRNAVLRQRTMCQFTEFTWDIPENRIIRQTVFAMSRAVRKPELQQRLAALDRALGEIDPVPLPLSTFGTFHYHRLNEDYRPIHRLCRLLLESSSVSEHSGHHDFRAFLLDMNKLYEQFLTVALREALPLPWQLLDQHQSHLDVDRMVTIRPDLLLVRNREPILIADAKYKLRTLDDSIHHDLYQMLAYCAAEGIDRGMLIYPTWEHAGHGTIAVRNSPVRIARETIDLSGSVTELRTDIRRLAKRMLGFGGHDIGSEILVA